MKDWTPDREGFITHYMVSGPLVEPFESGGADPNQLRHEAHLRSLMATHAPVDASAPILAGKPGRLGLPWRFAGGRDGAFLNLSDFYSVLKRVRFDAATVLCVPEDREVTAVVWSYAAVDVYCNGRLAGGVPSPVYKPIRSVRLTLPLRAGRNTVYLACEALGVRDTRSVVALQLSGAGGVTVTLPDSRLAEEAAVSLDFLESAALTPDRLRFFRPVPDGCEWAWLRHDPDFVKDNLPPCWQPVESGEALPLPPGEAVLALRVPTSGGWVRRVFERTEQIQPLFVSPTPTPEENLQLIYRRIAAVESLSRGEEFGFPISNILARYYLGDRSYDDNRLMAETLRLIDLRVDCSDFLVCGLLRWLEKCDPDKAAFAAARKTLLGFRYWMDQSGKDGMCFWSENHCLMFFVSAMHAGRLFPEAHFSAAGMSGAQLHAWGRGKVLEWLGDLEENGFEEFHSTVYTCVTFAALLHVVDFGEEDMSSRAARITDTMLRQLALHTFRGGIIAPQGRVYRGVLYPFAAGAMALMNLADPAQPYSYGEGWLGFYASSRYVFPSDMKELMAKEASLSYVSGSARIVLEKHRNWCLTSVQSPREPFTRWKNIAHEEDADPHTYDFVKSYNECFHGTTCFQPGVWGYQQHLWYAALDGAAVVFINHPGVPSEGGDLRPGYWHGNGVFPALRQEGALLGLIYRIPESHPVSFIHLYAPLCRFDEVKEAGGWLLLRKGQGYIGLWSSAPMESWQGMNTDCERRMEGRETACLCLCAGEEMDGMAAFERAALALCPAYDSAAGRLTAEGFKLVYLPGEDDTQYL